VHKKVPSLNVQQTFQFAAGFQERPVASIGKLESLPD